MEALNQLDGAASDFILPLSPTSPSNAGSCNPPPPLSPLLIHQLRTVLKMTADDQGLGDDVMGIQSSRASLAGVLEGGVGFVLCVLLCASLLMLLLLDAAASVLHSAADDDDCFYYHSWRNNVVIAFGTLSSFLT